MSSRVQIVCSESDVRFRYIDSHDQVVYDRRVSSYEALSLGGDLIRSALNMRDHDESEKRSWERRNSLMNEIGHCPVCNGDVDLSYEDGDENAELTCDVFGDDHLQISRDDLDDLIVTWLDDNDAAIEDDEGEQFTDLPGSPGIYAPSSHHTSYRIGLSGDGNWYSLGLDRNRVLLNQARTTLTSDDVQNLLPLVRVRGLESYEKGFMDGR